MLRMSLINVAVKSGPPSPCPFCCSVLVPLQCSQSQEQIVTLMMDIHPHPLHPPQTTPRLVSGHRPPLPLLPRDGRAGESTSQTTMFTPSVQREQKTTLHTDFISTDNFGGLRLSLEDFRNRGERSHGGMEGVSSCRNDATPDCRCANVLTLVYFWALTLQAAMFTSEPRGHSAFCPDATQTQLL